MGLGNRDCDQGIRELKAVERHGGHHRNLHCGQRRLVHWRLVVDGAPVILLVVATRETDDNYSLEEQNVRLRLMDLVVLPSKTLAGLLAGPVGNNCAEVVYTPE